MYLPKGSLLSVGEVGLQSPIDIYLTRNRLSRNIQRKISSIKIVFLLINTLLRLYQCF